MTAASKEFVVSPGQVIAAREYIKRVGDPRLISDRILEVATMSLDEVTRQYRAQPLSERNIHAARLVIELSGGEDNVDPSIVAIAHSEPEE